MAYDEGLAQRIRAVGKAKSPTPAIPNLDRIGRSEAGWYVIFGANKQPSDVPRPYTGSYLELLAPHEAV